LVSRGRDRSRRKGLCMREEEEEEGEEEGCGEFELWIVRSGALANAWTGLFNQGCPCES
jgi:hypothetical protein